MNKILLAPTKELAASIPQPEATVEAEYGGSCIEGKEITLAHHVEKYKDNPAPCNTDLEKTLDGATILVSHIDLDTLGGIFAISGEKMDDPEFWQAAEFIDLNGPHHIHELSDSFFLLLLIGEISLYRKRLCYDVGYGHPGIQG